MEMASVLFEIACKTARDKPIHSFRYVSVFNRADLKNIHDDASMQDDVLRDIKEK